MKISEKIEEIRQEPEHIRLRYVWGSVTVSMLFILAIWIFSMGSLFQGDKNESTQDATGITEQLQTLKEQAPSIKDFTGQALETANEGINNNGQSSDFQYPATKTQDSTPQTDAYSDLPNTATQQ